jgi:hypothetical protein
MRYRGKLGVLVLVSCLVAQRAQAYPVNGTAMAQIPLPGGLADPGGRIGYLSSVNHGIEAIDLLTGDLLWSSHEAEVPLLVANDRLYAQAGTKRNRMRVLVFDLTHKAEVVLESNPVVFADWVVTGDAPGRSFKTEWRLEKDHLVLSWQARAWYAGKVKPTPALEAEARKTAEGLVRIHLTTGQVQHSPAEAPGVALGIPVPQKDLEKKSVRWKGLLQDQYKAVVMEENGDGQKLTLLTWDHSGAKVGEPRELFSGRRLTVLPTLDERILCIHEAAPSPEQRVASEDSSKFAWALISLETGNLVARVAFEASTQAMTLVGPRLFVQQSGPIRGSLADPAINTRTLKAIDLKTGRFLWQRNIAGKAVHPPER